MSTANETAQLSLILESGYAASETAQIYQLPTRAQESTYQSMLDDIAETPEGVEALIQKVCDLVDGDYEAKNSFVFKKPAITKNVLKARLAHLEYEVFAVLFLDNKHREIAFKPMFKGTIDECSVYPREVVKEALRLNAAACVLSHNHPSLDVSESNADVALTKRLKEALAFVDVRVLDHIIVGAGEPNSLAENGLM